MRLLCLLSILTLLAGCGREPVEIRFASTWGGAPVDCESRELALTDLRFYVSDIELLGSGGKAEALGPVALIDLENGRGGCQNGTDALQASITGELPPGEYRGLRFTLGVPFDKNHANPLTAAPPLDDPAMHWHWRSGYKFLRAGLQRGKVRYRLHLGSARCRGVIGKLEGCDASNRVEVLLDNFDSERGEVVFDFAELLNEFDPQDNALQVCEMGPDEAACETYRVSLGLNQDGVSIRPARIFRAEAGP